jgi:hypothetical protein
MVLFVGKTSRVYEEWRNVGFFPDEMQRPICGTECFLIRMKNAITYT